VQAYAEANRLHDRHPKILCNLGVLYFQMEAYGEAEKVLKIAVETDPDYARAWDNLAAAFGAQEKLEEALEAANRAVALKPNNAEAHFKIGLIHFARQDWEAAETEFKLAGSAASLRGDCDLLLALICCREDKIDEAEAAVRRASATEPKSELLWMAWNDLGLARLAENDFSRAAFAFEAARKEAPEEPGVWINQGVTQHRSGEKEAARRSFEKAVELNPSLAVGWHNLGTVCADLGDYAAAVAAFQRETKEVPDNVRAWYDLGVAFEKLGRHDDAKEAFAKAERSPAPNVAPPANATSSP
jgi:superkiller protein 3